MDKNILLDYIDACDLIRETEEDIRKLKRRKDILQDSVRGSNPEWPYEARSFRIAGTRERLSDKSMLAEEERILEERKENAKRLKLQVEGWLSTIPMRMQRIIRFKLFEGMSWDEVAAKLGRNCTADAIRMEYKRFMEKD